MGTSRLEAVSLIPVLFAGLLASSVAAAAPGLEARLARLEGSEPTASGPTVATVRSWEPSATERAVVAVSPENAAAHNRMLRTYCMSATTTA